MRNCLERRVFIIIMMALTATSLRSEQTDADQSARRAGNPVQIGVLPNFGSGDDSILYASYTLSPSLNISGVGYFMNPSGSHLGISRDTLAVQQSRQLTNKPVFTVTADYFPVQRLPLYGYGGVGSGQASRGFSNVEYIDALDLFAGGATSRATTYTITPTISVHYAAGVGFKWIFSGGMMVNLELGLKESPGAELRVHVANDYRAFLPGDVPESPERLLLKQALYKDIFSRYDYKHDIHSAFAVGYAF